MLLTCIQNYGAGPGCLVLELFVSGAYVASYHAHHIYPRPVFLALKLHVSVERF